MESFKKFKKAVLLSRIIRFANKCHDTAVAKRILEGIPYQNEEIHEIWKDRYEKLSIRDMQCRIPNMSLMEMLAARSGMPEEVCELLKKKILELYPTHVFTNAHEARQAYSDAWNVGDTVRRHFWNEFLRLTREEASSCTSIQKACEEAFSRDSSSEVKKLWDTRLDELCFQDALNRSPKCATTDEVDAALKQCFGAEGRKVWRKRFDELSNQEAPAASAVCEDIAVALEKYNKMTEGTPAKEIWEARLLVLVQLKLKATRNIHEVTALYRDMSKIESVLGQLNVRYMELFTCK